MRFMYLSEGDAACGQTHEARYWELVEQVIHAEKWGFDLFGVSEQHMAVGAATTASPEVLYGYLYGKTSRIRFRHAISLIPVNHPLKVAANVAVSDILSNVVSNLESAAATPRFRCGRSRSISAPIGTKRSKASRF